MDGYFNLVFMFVFLSLAYLWRPTSNNQRYGLSELSQEDPGLDLEEGDDNVIGLEVVRGNDDDEELDDQERARRQEEEPGEDVIRWVQENIIQDLQEPSKELKELEEEEEKRQLRALADQEEVEGLIAADRAERAASRSKDDH